MWGRSGFGEPGFGFGEFRLIEILNLGQREGFAEGGHALFPFGFADDGEAFDVFPVLEVELHVFPDRSGGPAVEVVHLEEDAELAVFLDELIDEGGEGLVGLLGQLTGDFDVEEFSRGDDFEGVEHWWVSCGVTDVSGASESGVDFRVLGVVRQAGTMFQLRPMNQSEDC